MSFHLHYVFFLERIIGGLDEGPLMLHDSISCIYCLSDECV